jgi:hypothetical protein
MATSTFLPPKPSGPPPKQSQTAHELVVKVAFEAIGVGLLALLADTNKTAGSIIVTLMVGFLFIWLITSGAAYVRTFNKGLQG